MLLSQEVTTMERREAPPAHFQIKIEPFSLLDTCGIDKYETTEFVAGEYKWRLIIYPNGDNDVGKNGDYVSLYLAMADKNSLPANWEVNAVFSIFLFHQISGNYDSLTGKAKRFHGMKSEWGFEKFVSKKDLLDPSKGYVINDSCVFGAEVFVLKREAVTECLYLKNDVIPYERDWKIPNFSQIAQVWQSEEFTAGGHKWRIKLYPKGSGSETGRSVSMFLYYLGSESVKAYFTISINNQVSDEYWEGTDTIWFSASADNWGWYSFIELATINDPKKGFIVKDCCHLSIEISVQAVAKLSP